MLEQANEVVTGADAAGADAEVTVTLTYDERKRSRLRTRMDNGEELAILIPRGSSLHHGDLLRAQGGRLIRVNAAVEPLSAVHAADALALARVCYHLGNRHVPVQIGPGWVRYRRDHVVDDMVRNLGLDVSAEPAQFQPEPGAYGGGHQH